MHLANLYFSFILEIKTYLYERYMQVACIVVMIIATVCPAAKPDDIDIVGVWYVSHTKQ